MLNIIRIFTLGHANSLSELRNSPPPTPVSSASSVTSIAAGIALGAAVSSSANTNSQPFSMPSSVAVPNLVGDSLPLTTSVSTRNKTYHNLPIILARVLIINNILFVNLLAVSNRPISAPFAQVYCTGSHKSSRIEYIF